MSYENVKNFRSRLKERATYVLGGKCQICGYDKCIQALDFHHVNPEEKTADFNANANRSWQTTREEIKKCILLCANCHRETHNEDLFINNISELIKTAEDKKSFSNQNDYGSICPVCNTKFSKSKGKVYCSDKCRDSVRYANYPSIDEIETRYTELGSWEKVAQSFNLTRKIIQGIRKRSTKK